jgi:hypothetical protein
MNCKSSSHGRREVEATRVLVWKSDKVNNEVREPYCESCCDDIHRSLSFRMENQKMLETAKRHQFHYRFELAA